jgi:putative nucleotidyltransferase with HDIG domain
MEKTIFKKIIKDSQEEVKRLANKNGWLWFYKMHQNEVIKYAEKLLNIYGEADKEIVLISCWLHDIGHYYARNGKEIIKVKKEHHTNGAEIAGEFLKKYNLEKEEVDKIKNCILRHRNHAPYLAETLEEKIVVAADTLSHFGSIFYLTYFKFHPAHSLERMVKDDLEKIERDWRDLQIIPEAKKMAETEYKTLKKLLENYNKD